MFQHLLQLKGGENFIVGQVKPVKGKSAKINEGKMYFFKTNQ